jgi:predicted nucleic acid-binding protein
MNAVDTNVLVYAHDPRDAKKQTVAISLIESLNDAALLWQVACEYVSASKKLEPFGYSRQQAWQDIQDLRFAWAAVLPNWDVADRAQRLMDHYSLAYWDALLIAACLEAGIARLFSEDFSGYSSIDGVEVVNPFSQSP